MATIDSNNCIPTGLRADIMRSSMENKNLLSKKGSIYVGTGETVTVGGEKIYKTKALELGSSGQVLIVKDGELKYSTLTNESFDAGIDYTALRNNTFKNYKLAAGNFNATGSYSNILLSNANFSSDINYKNLNFFPNSTPYDISTQIGKDCGIFHLCRDSSTGRMSLAWTNFPVYKMFRYNVTIAFPNDYPYINISFLGPSDTTGKPTSIDSLETLTNVLPSINNQFYFTPTGGRPHTFSIPAIAVFLKFSRAYFYIYSSSGTKITVEARDTVYHFDSDQVTVTSEITQLI